MTIYNIRSHFQLFFAARFRIWSLLSSQTMGSGGQTKSKAAKKAKGARAAAKASAGSGGRKALTIPQRAMQKLRENFRHLSEHGQMVKVHAPYRQIAVSTAST